MENSFYNFAEILVCDPVVSNRAATRAALHALGFRHIAVVGSLGDLSEALDRQPPDLVVCEAQAGEDELCRVIRELRRGDRGSNPFVVVIATAWATNSMLTMKLSDAGADDLLLRPFSAKSLDHRIQTHVMHRKPFVVTPDYIGPERRTGADRAPGTTVFDAPNSLKTKMAGRFNIEDANRRFHAELREARARLNAEKLKWARLSSLD